MGILSGAAVLAGYIVLWLAVAENLASTSSGEKDLLSDVM
jgi:hypothetical protein